MVGNIIYHIVVGIVSGFWAFLFCRVLASPDMIAEKWSGFVQWCLYGNCPPVARKSWQRGIEKVAYDCPVCQSFWWAFLCSGFTFPEFLWATGVAMFVAYFCDQINDEEWS